MRNSKPNAVVLELCPLRVHILDLDEQKLLKEAKDLSPEKVREILKNQGFAHGLFYLTFLRASAGITEQLGVAPGGEARRAVAEAKRLGRCKVLLGDRPMNITLSRALDGLSFKEKMKITLALNTPDGSTLPITQADIEKYKFQKESEAIAKMRSDMPSVYQAFVTERDVVLAHSLALAVDVAKKARLETEKPVNVVGVVGIGHLQGVLANYGKTSTTQVNELMTMKPSKMSSHPVNNNGIYWMMTKNWWNICSKCIRKR